MKQFLLSITFLFISIFTWAQCDPIYDFGDEPWGVAPDTIVNLNSGEMNSVYAQQIDVLVPVNSDPFGIPGIQVDSASLAQVIGLPDGLSFECNSTLSTPCTYLGGEQGCGIISGIPTEEGLFELTVVVQLYYTLIQPSSLSVPLEGYEIQIGDPLNDGLVERDTELSLFPNPANTSFKINFDYHQTEEVSVTIYDIVGKEALSLKKIAQQGINSFTIPVEELREGTYIVRLDGAKMSATKRLVVNK